MTKRFYEELCDCITDSDKTGLLMQNHTLTGYSGHALCGTLQRIARLVLDQEKCYVEVGVYQGLTLLSAALANQDSHFYGIDNFAFFDKKGINKKLVEDRTENLRLNNVKLINCDYEDALENLGDHIGSNKVGLYFVDGPHDYRSQLMCLLLIEPFLADDAVIIVDDCNFRHVRQANRDFLCTHPQFKLLFQTYTQCHPNKASSDVYESAVKGWWNGVNILVKDSNNLLQSGFPETIRDRTLYENDHLLHGSQYPELVLTLWQIFRKLGLFPLLKLVKRPKKHFAGSFTSVNTYSENLLRMNFNKSLRVEEKHREE